jgi:hypothetical protein
MTADVASVEVRSEDSSAPSGPKVSVRRAGVLSPKLRCVAEPGYTSPGDEPTTVRIRLRERIIAVAAKANFVVKPADLDRALGALTGRCSRGQRLEFSVPFTVDNAAQLRKEAP